MSTSDSSIKGKFDELSGKVKQGLGDTFNDQRLANKGAAQEVKGHAEQAWGSVKEASSDTAHQVKADHEAKAETEGHDIREKITSTAQNVKEHIQDAFGKKHD